MNTESKIQGRKSFVATRVFKLVLLGLVTVAFSGCTTLDDNDERRESAHRRMLDQYFWRRAGTDSASWTTFGRPDADLGIWSNPDGAYGQRNNGNR